MSEKHEIHERKNFWKWIAIFLIIAIIVFGFGYCNPFGKTFNDFRYDNLEQDGNNRFIPDRFEKDIPKYNEENGNLEEHNVDNGEKKTSNFYTNLPSTKYRLIYSESLRGLARRFHCSVPEIKQENPNLGDLRPNQPIDKGEEINIPDDDKMQGYELEVLKLTNAERTKAGLSPLKGDDSQLNKSATAKSQDMSDTGNFSHNSNRYGTPFEMMKSFGITYRYAAENIAKGQKTPSEVVRAWMNSAGHRANILNGNLTHMGVGYVAKGDYWTQQFVGK